MAFADSLSDFFLPSDCLLCSKPGNMALCNACIKALPDPGTCRCEQCGLRLEAATDENSVRICGQCLSDPPAFDHSLIATDYAPPLDMLAHDLKFRARLPLARAFGQLLVDAAGATLSQADVLIPVPLATERLALRGFNQALEIARPVAAAWNMPLLADICIRIRNTGAQAELPLSQRRVNMRGAFAVRDRKVIENRHVLVVDDVMTTGHTLRELAACLKRRGAMRVSNLVLARTPLR